MLRHFDAALSRLWEARSLNYLADLAEECLGAPVLLVSRSTRASIIAAGARVRSAGVDPPDTEGAVLAPAADGATLVGLPTGFPPPFDRTLTVPLAGSGRQAALRVFPGADGIRGDALAAVAPILARAIAESEAAERQRAELVRFVTILGQMERVARIGIFEFDIAGGRLFWSDEVFRIHDLVPGPTPTFREALDYYPEPGRSRLREALRQTVATGTPVDLVLPLVTARNARRMVRVIASRESDACGTGRLAGVFQDVTVHEEITERLWWTANHDILTGLPNRGLFGDRFSAALDRRKRSGTALALVLVDVDEFKSVNDTLGHPAGDELLRLVAQHLKGAVRETDTVARTGGDEFSILLDGVGSVADLEPLFERLREALSVRLVSGEQTMIVTMSAGAAIAPVHGATARELSSAADLALYRAKGPRRGNVVVFDPAFGAALEERNKLLADVRQALDEGRVVPFYQPEVDVVSGRIVGVEALARWVTGGKVRPVADFLPAMSDHEIGMRVGVAVVDRAIAEIAALNSGRKEKIALSVNVSAGDLVRRHFLERIGRDWQEAGARAPITVEISDDIVPEAPCGHAAGSDTANLRVAVAGVGSGAPTLVDVSTMPIPEVRIARGVVSGLKDDAERRVVVRGVIDVGRALGVRVVIEGVETRDEVEEIAALGGRFLQGITCSKPVPIEELRRLLAAEAVRLHEAA